MDRRPVPGTAPEIGNLALDLRKAKLIGILDDRNDETLRCADGDTDVVIVLVDELVAIDLGVHRRPLLERDTGGTDEESHESKLHAVFLFERLLIGGAQVHGGAHVDFVPGGQHRRRLLRLLETARDHLAELGHAHPFFAGIVGARRQPLRGGEGLHRSGGRRGRWARLFRRRAGLNGGQHVAFGDAPVLAGAGDTSRVEVVVVDQFPDGGRGIDFDRDFIRLQFDQGFVRGDSITGFLEPLGDRRLGHGLA